jgi:hypothetical protein
MFSRDRLDRPLIFIGPGRSGSTVISEVVLAHELLGWPSNYLEHLPRSPWLNGVQRLLDNSLWRLVGEKSQLNRTRHLNALLPRPAEAYPFWAALTGPDVDFARGFLLGEQPTPEVRDRVRRALQRMLAWQGKSRLSMKLTGPGRIGYLNSLFPGARFINVVRDPVATVQSLLKVPFWAQLGMHRLWWTGAYSDTEIVEYETLRDDPVASTAFQIGKILRTTREEAAACGVPMLTVAYESFIARPRATTATILDFAGLPPSRWIERKLDSMQIHDRNRASVLNASQVRLVESLI